MRVSAARREAIPAWASIFWSRSPFALGLLSSFFVMRRVDKPWGHEIIWAETERYVAKLLHIVAGHKLSRQYHERKDETFYVQTGEMDLEVGDEADRRTLRMRAGDAFHCAPRTVHRMIAITDVDVFEASTPELEDVVRLEDAYGREGTNHP